MHDPGTLKFSVAGILWTALSRKTSRPFKAGECKALRSDEPIIVNIIIFIFNIAIIIMVTIFVAITITIITIR